jgi:hypothetical protein
MLSHAPLTFFEKNNIPAAGWMCPHHFHVYCSVFLPPICLLCLLPLITGHQVPCHHGQFWVRKHLSHHTILLQQGDIFLLTLSNFFFRSPPGCFLFINAVPTAFVHSTHKGSKNEGFQNTSPWMLFNLLSFCVFTTLIELLRSGFWGVCHYTLPYLHITINCFTKFRYFMPYYVVFPFVFYPENCSPLKCTNSLT